MKLSKFLPGFLFFSLVLISAFTTKAERYKIDVSNFTSLSIDNGFRVVYHNSPDSASFVSFDCSPETAAKIYVTDRKNKLVLQLQIDENLPKNLPTIYVSSPRLENITNSGDSLVVVNLNEKVEKFNAKVIGNGSMEILNLNANSATAKITTGNGSIFIKGTSNSLNLSIAGTGTIDAAEVSAKSVTATAVGPGIIICNPADKLLLYGMSGKIYYVSTPKEIKRRGMGTKALPYDSIH